MYLNNCVEGKISEFLFDTAHKTPSAQEVETLKLQLSSYNSYFTGEIQEGACEWLMLLIVLHVFREAKFLDNLNPIEHVGCHSECCKCPSTPCDTLQELDVALHQEWNQVPQQTCRNLV